MVGAMNVSSCSMVGLRNTGEVARMKSFQNWPGASSTSGGGPEPHQALLEPARLEGAGERLLDDEHDAEAAGAAAAPIPTQLFVGPNAPSGKNTTVFLLTNLLPNMPTGTGAFAPAPVGPSQTAAAAERAAA